MKEFNQIQQNLHRFIKKYYLNELFKGLILFVVFSLLYIFVTALVEYFLWLPAQGRKYLFYALWIVLILFFVLFVSKPLLNLLGIIHSLSDEKAARIVGRFFPEISDKLLNTLQLKGLDFDSELLQASIEQRAVQLNKFKFSKAVNFKQNYKYLPLLLIPVFIFLFLKLTRYDKVIQQGYERVLSYNKNFEPPLPYRVYLPDSLSVLQGQDFLLHIKLKGDEFPEKLYIAFDNDKILCKRENDSLFSFYFPVLTEPTSFQLFDPSHFLGDYRLNIIYPPVIQDVTIRLDYPSYLHKKTKILKYTGNFTVPQSTRIHWILKTKHTDSIRFYINQKKLIFPLNNNKLIFDTIAENSFTYRIHPVNHLNISTENSIYKIDVITDEKPAIKVIEKRDTINFQNYYHITASDDYAVIKLQLVYTNQKTGEMKILPISINKSTLIQQNYVFPGDLELDKGAPYTYFFQVFDNDSYHNFKSTKSQTFYFNKLTNNQLEQLQLERQQQQIALLNNLQDRFARQNKSISKLKNEITTQKSMNWQSKKQLQQSIHQAEQQEQFFKEAIKKYKDLLNKMPENKKDDTKIDLQKRLDELAQMEKKKQLLDELKKLADKLKKEDLIKKLKELENYSEHQEKSLERILELTKKYYLQQKLQKLSEQLDRLSKKQDKLANENNDTKQQQDSLNKQADELKKQLDSLQKMNQTLKKPMPLQDNPTEMQDIKNDMQKASEMLQQNQSGQANKNQRKAANKMKQLSKDMQMAMMSGGGEQQQEDIKTLQAILKSLLNFSFKQELLLSDLYQHKGKSYLSQQLITQSNLKKYFKHINDSLYTLALRNPKISQKILDEAYEIDNNLQKALNFLSENQSFNTQNAAQYILKGANSLADFLSNSLDNMKNGMPSMGQGQGKKGKGFSLPDIIKKQQNAISQAQNGMKQDKGKKDGEKGKNNQGKGEKQKQGKEGEASKQYELYKQQQRIKEDLQQLSDQFSDKGQKQRINDLIKQMDELDKRILKEGITKSVLNKMIALQHELLKLKNATFTQHQDEKRESRTNFKSFSGIDSLFLPENNDFKSEIERLKRLQLPVNQIIKKKIIQFLN